MSDVTVRNTRFDDIPGVLAVSARAYPGMEQTPADDVASQIKVFPEGQFVAELEGRIVGAASSLIVSWDDYGLDHDWEEVTEDGTFASHDPGGRTLYGAEVFVDPTIRKKGVGKAIYAARRRLCRSMNLKRIIAAGRLPNYHRHADRMSVRDYAMKVIWGELYDPVLRFQLSQGFQFCGVIEGYLPEDEESRENAALIVWLNPRYNPRKPTQPARKVTSP